MTMATMGPSNHHGEQSEEHQLVMNGFGEEGGRGREREEELEGKCDEEGDEDAEQRHMVWGDA